MAKGKSPAAPRIKNARARFDYEIIETYEAGIALTGPEVKSLRSGRASLHESFAVIRGGEAFLKDCNITPYENASYGVLAPVRERKLLLHRAQIRKLLGKVQERGLTLIPLAIFFNDAGLAKVELALARGKKTHDKRDSLKQRDHTREIARAMRRG